MSPETDCTDDRFEQFIKQVTSYNPSSDVAALRRAYDFAKTHHVQQLRKDGSPYITHPVATAQIVAEMGLDDDSLI